MKNEFENSENEHTNWADVTYQVIEWAGIVAVLLILAKCSTGSI